MGHPIVKDEQVVKRIDAIWQGTRNLIFSHAKITFQPANIQIHCTPEQSIAEAAQEQGVEMFLGCDNGLCMICQSERISGTFHFRNDLGLDVLEREDRVLCCVAKPLTDAELYMPSIHAADHIKPNSYACQIARVVEIGAAMWR